MTEALKLPNHALKHREDFYHYVVDHSEGWVRPFLLTFYDHWHNWNEQFFEGKLIAPYILIAVPTSPRAEGDCSPISGFGGRLQIRVRPSLLTGDAKHLRSGDEFLEGRKRYSLDVLLHEMIHQWQQEVTHVTEESFHGHGNGFRDKCNEIGITLGLPPVRNSKKRGNDKDLPSCAYWPHNVRPIDYYLGALKPVDQPIDTPEENNTSSDGVFIPLDPEKAAEVIFNHFEEEAINKLVSKLGEYLETLN